MLLLTCSKKTLMYEHGEILASPVLLTPGPCSKPVNVFERMLYCPAAAVKTKLLNPAHCH